MLNVENPDPFERQTALSNKSKFNSCIIVSDEYHPKDLLEKLLFTL